MIKLLHHKLDPNSRLIRLILAEYEIEVEFEDASHFKRTKNLVEHDALATAPILLVKNNFPIIGALAIINYIEDVHNSENSLIPTDIAVRAETWRLYELIMGKFNDEISRYIIEEKIGKKEQNLGAPDPAILRVAKVNLSEQIKYFTYLFATRGCLASKNLTLADFTLAAHFSCLDYLNHIDWAKAGEIKDWYAKIKSRPAFRDILNDRMVGMPASKHYKDLDF